MTVWWMTNLSWVYTPVVQLGLSLNPPHNKIMRSEDKDIIAFLSFFLTLKSIHPTTAVPLINTKQTDDLKFVFLYQTAGTEATQM